MQAIFRISSLGPAICRICVQIHGSMVYCLNSEGAVTVFLSKKRAVNVVGRCIIHVWTFGLRTKLTIATIGHQWPRSVAAERSNAVCAGGVLHPTTLPSSAGRQRLQVAPGQRAAKLQLPLLATATGAHGFPTHAPLCPA